MGDAESIWKLVSYTDFGITHVMPSTPLCRASYSGVGLQIGVQGEERRSTRHNSRSFAGAHPGRGSDCRGGMVDV